MLRFLDITPSPEPWSELLDWVNASMPVMSPSGCEVSMVTKVEQCGCGVPYVLMLPMMLPIVHKPLLTSQVKVPAKANFDAVANLKLMQAALRRNGVAIPEVLTRDAQKLIEGNFQANLKLLQWFRGLFLALERNGVKSGDDRVVLPVRSDSESFSSVSSRPHRGAALARNGSQELPPTCLLQERRSKGSTASTGTAAMLGEGQGASFDQRSGVDSTVASSVQRSPHKSLSVSPLRQSLELTLSQHISKSVRVSSQSQPEPEQTLPPEPVRRAASARTASSVRSFFGPKAEPVILYCPIDPHRVSRSSTPVLSSSATICAGGAGRTTPGDSRAGSCGALRKGVVAHQDVSGDLGQCDRAAASPPVISAPSEDDQRHSRVAVMRATRDQAATPDLMSGTSGGGGGGAAASGRSPKRENVGGIAPSLNGVAGSVTKSSVHSLPASAPCVAAAASTVSLAEAVEECQHKLRAIEGLVEQVEEQQREQHRRTGLCDPAKAELFQLAFIIRQVLQGTAS